MRHVTRTIVLAAFALVLPAAIFGIWWIASAGDTAPYWPPLSRIVLTFRQQWLFQQVPSELWPSLRRVVEGYTLAAVGGVTVGTCLGMFKAARDALAPILDFARSVPGAALIPPAVLLLGVGDTSKVAIIAWISVWPILLNTIDGVRGVELGFVELGRAYRLRRRDRIFRVVLPSASPQIFSGLRVSVSLAMLAMVVAELFASTSGIGYVISEAESSFDIRQMWAATFVLMVMSYFANAGFVFIENRVLAWHRGWRASVMGEPLGTLVVGR
jgi:ABC-type nitrate/sulfonate/bicarbonate transport system permease component